MRLIRLPSRILFKRLNSVTNHSGTSLQRLPKREIMAAGFDDFLRKLYRSKGSLTAWPSTLVFVMSVER